MKTPAQAQQTVRSPSEAREEFRKHGVSVSSWAAAQGFELSLVKDVLAGRVKGNYGKAHDIAVALGIKPPPGKPPAFLRT